MKGTYTLPVTEAGRLSDNLPHDSEGFMEVLTPSAELNSFFRKLSCAQHRLLILDYDGTLAPFHVERNQAFPYEGIAPLIGKIARDPHSRIVICSGRTVADLIPLLREFDPLPDIWGSHGAEKRLPDGNIYRVPLSKKTESSLTSARSWAESHMQADRCDFKAASIAVHWRGLSENQAQNLEEQVVQAWTPLLKNGAGLELQHFDGGIELRTLRLNKGAVVEELLAQVGKQAVVAYLGDDRTDEDAFHALHGRGLGILVRETARPTAADLWIKPPEELLDFLTNWKQAAE